MKRSPTTDRVRRLWRSVRPSLLASAAGAAAIATLGGCGMLLGLGDHELFAEGGAAPDDSLPTGDAGEPLPDPDAFAAQTVDAGADAAPDGPGAADSAPDGPAHSQADSGAEAASACPAESCAPGSTCCYSAESVQTGVCENSCGPGSYALGCTEKSECAGSVCCGTLQAIDGRYAPPLCGGWVFEGSACGACAPSEPTVCGEIFKLEMCASATDCTTEQPECCRVAGDIPFTFCASSTMCLPP